MLVKFKTNLQSRLDVIQGLYLLYGWMWFLSPLIVMSRKGKIEVHEFFMLSRFERRLALRFSLVEVQWDRYIYENSRIPGEVTGLLTLEQAIRRSYLGTRLHWMIQSKIHHKAIMMFARLTNPKHEFASAGESKVTGELLWLWLKTGSGVEVIEGKTFIRSTEGVQQTTHVNFQEYLDGKISVFTKLAGIRILGVIEDNPLFRFNLYQPSNFDIKYDLTDRCKYIDLFKVYSNAYRKAYNARR